MLILTLLAAGAEISGDKIDFVMIGSDGPGDRKYVERRTEFKTFLEIKLGNQMPSIVEIGKDKQDKPIYRQMTPDGNHVKTYQEKEQELHKKFKPL